MRIIKEFNAEESLRPEDLTVRDMLEQMEEVNILAPLVRCSKSHLNSTFQTSGLHVWDACKSDNRVTLLHHQPTLTIPHLKITHTPMMLAPEFSRAQTARISDFSTSRAERGVFWMRPRRLGCVPEDEDIGEGSNGLEPLEQYSDATFTESRPRTGNTSGRSTPSFPLDNRRSSSPPARLPTTRTRPSPEHRLVRGKLIAQFAASNGKTLADACEIINVPPTPTEEDTCGQLVGNSKTRDSFPNEEYQTQRLVNGVDLNCGCPQPWAYSEGIGSALLRQPELVADMVKQVHARMGDDFAISVKIRVDDEDHLTERLVQTAVHAKVDHLTIHGRTRLQASTEPVSLPKIKFAVECAKGEVPCVGNGDIWEFQDVQEMRDSTGVKGVMAARGLLANPALFANYRSTPKEAVEQFVDLTTAYGLPYSLFQRHISYMLESTMSKYDRLYLNSLGSYAGVTDWLGDRGLKFPGRDA